MATKYRNNQIIFKIDGFTPATLPSARLAQYLLDLNALFGSTEKVHFQKLGKGSAQIIQWAEEKALPAIRQRVIAAKLDKANRPPEITAAYERLNAKLIEDNSVGDLRIGREKLLEFPGKRIEARRIIGPITQNEYLDGQLVRVGGVDETIPVHLREGETIHYCTTNDVDTARKLGSFLYGQTIRVFGVAYWYRDEKGKWRLDRFKVESFQPLEDVPLHEAVERLRSIPHEDWDEAITDKIKLREGG
jgi:hypothetical protein